MTHPIDMEKKGYKYYTAFSVEKPCIGGTGAKPAFDILRGMKGIKCLRDYSQYIGHTAFQIWTKSKLHMYEALNLLHEEYSWIDRGDKFYNMEETKSIWRHNWG